MQVQEKYGIVTQAYASLAPVHRHPTGGPVKPILTEIATKISGETGQNVDEAAILILWTRAKGVVCITSSSDEDRIRRMAGTQNMRDLSADEVKRIDEAGRRVHFRHWVGPMLLSRQSC
jgi:diketogulonate reductase-like aldo/keto reductase